MTDENPTGSILKSIYGERIVQELQRPKLIDGKTPYRQVEPLTEEQEENFADRANKFWNEFMELQKKYGVNYENADSYGASASVVDEKDYRLRKFVFGLELTDDQD